MCVDSRVCVCEYVSVRICTRVFGACVCVCVCAQCIHAYTTRVCTYIRMWRQLYTRTWCVYVHRHVNTPTHTLLRTDAHTDVRTYIHWHLNNRESNICIYIYIYICMCVWLFVCLYVCTWSTRVLLNVTCKYFSLLINSRIIISLPHYNNIFVYYYCNTLLLFIIGIESTILRLRPNRKYVASKLQPRSTTRLG